MCALYTAIGARASAAATARYGAAWTVYGYAYEGGPLLSYNNKLPTMFNIVTGQGGKILVDPKSGTPTQVQTNSGYTPYDTYANNILSGYEAIGGGIVPGTGTLYDTTTALFDPPGESVLKGIQYGIQYGVWVGSVNAAADVLHKILLKQYDSKLLTKTGPIEATWFNRAIDIVLQNARIINEVADKFGIPRSIIGSIVLKEMYTQLPPSDLAAIVGDFILPGRQVQNASVGPGANSIKQSRTSWDWYSKDYVAPPGYKKADIPNWIYSDIDLLSNLTMDTRFNIQTTAVNLLYDAHVNGSDAIGSNWSQNPGTWTESQWKLALNSYNNNNGYANKVLDYRGAMENLLGVYLKGPLA